MLVIIDCLPCKEPEEIASTIGSIRKTENNYNIDFALINYSFKQSYKHSESLAVTNLNNKKEILELSLNYKYLFFIKSGAKVNKKLLRNFHTETKLENKLFAFKELNESYPLNKNYSPSTVVNIESGLRIWAGSNGFICSSKFYSEFEYINEKEQDFFNKLFLKILTKEKKYKFINGGVESLHPLEDTYKDEEFLYTKEWYLSLNDYWIRKFSSVDYLALKDKKHINLLYLYHLSWCFWHNYNYKNKTRLWQEQINDFLKGVELCLQNITEEEIFLVTQDLYTNNLHQHYRIFLLKIKHPANSLCFSYEESNIFLNHKEKKLLSIKTIPLDIELVNIKNKHLILHCFYRFPLDNITIQAETGLKTYPFIKYGNYYNFNSMGIPIASDFDGIVKIPIENIKNEISFSLTKEKTKIDLSIRFTRLMSKLGCTNTYWRHQGIILRHNNKNLIIEQRSLLKEIKYESLFLFSLIKEKKYEGLFLKVIYWLTKPFFNEKKIWIYSDKMYKAGDNAEYLFKYSLTQKDANNHYYILRNDVPDAKRFKTESLKFIKYSSLYHKLLFLNSDIVFSTHSSLALNHLSPKIAFDFKNLFTYQTVCLQHGLTVQDMVLFQNQKIDNISLYCLASPVEKENLAQPEYKYEKNMLIKTGLARYDGLTNNPKKQILIAPTWRNYLAAPAVQGNSREHVKRFISSSYYKIYSSLIENKILLKALSEGNYTAVLLLHPVVSSQACDFFENEFIKVIPATSEMSYEKILTESALLITDYSGIQFDFAYMNKPVLYYHPEDLPASYEEGAYSYSSMALGEIYKEEPMLVNAIQNHIINNCKISQEYSSRINNFFYYRDQNNCKRIYNQTIKLSESNNP